VSDMIIGYTQGTFDMFHIGHLNLLQNARQQCDYLIVGVNDDALVVSYKDKKPIVPLEERIRIVEAVRYVDEVIGCDSLDKESIWKKYRYNKLFIGDDWKGNTRWNQTEKELKKYHVEVIYLPYTQSVCSTVMRERLYAALSDEGISKENT